MGATMKKVVATCYFPAFDPPMSGGEAKVLNFYKQLGRHYDVHLLSLTYPTRTEIVHHTPTFTEHRIAKPPVFEEYWYALTSAGASGELSGLSAALMGRVGNELTAKMEELVEDADIVIYDFPYMLASDPRPAQRGKLRVYNSHNFESSLFRGIVHNAPPEAYEMIERLEYDTCRAADVILATSEEEAKVFSLYYGISRDRISVVTLGYEPDDFRPVDIRNTSRTLPEPGFCFFIGSQHAPNIAAAEQVLELANEMPHERFVIAGSVCDGLPAGSPNTLLLGKVSDPERRRLFQDAGVFVNPMRQGAGVNVKMVEAFGAGLPMVSTKMGARGIDADERHMRVVETVKEMAQATRQFLETPKDEALTLRAERQKLADAKYSWRILADRAAGIFESASKKSGAAEKFDPLTLFINDFPIGDGLAGGQRRMLELIRHVNIAGEKVILTLTPEHSMATTLRAPDFTEINVPKQANQRQFEARMNERNLMSIADVAASLYARDNALFARWFQKLASRASTIVLEHPYLAPLLELLPKDSPRPRIVYNAYNVETDLKKEMARAYHHTHAVQVGQIVAEVEALAVQTADKIVAVTDADANRFVELFELAERPIVVPNGTQVFDDPPERIATDPDDPIELIFIGSAHPPNVSAMQEFVSSVMPQLEDCCLLIVGSVGNALQTKALPKNVAVLGEVSDKEKWRLLQAADIAVNPLSIGGGSSLKIGDFLAAGLPTVTTAIGIRGFDLTNEQEVLIANPGRDFAQAVQRLRRDPDLKAKLSRCGMAYAREHLDWRVVGAKYSNLLEAQTTAIAPPAVKSLLVVTFRYTEPRSGGAEEYLFNVMSSLGTRNDLAIDLLSLDVERIENTMGVVCEGFGAATRKPLYAPFARRLRLYDIDRRDPGELKEASLLLSHASVLERATLANRLATSARESVLLGGWYPLESSGASHWRWTSESASILLVGDCTKLRLRGYAPRFGVVTMHRDGALILSQRVSNEFEINAPCLVSGRGRIDVKFSAASRPEGDIRVLGLLIREVLTYDESWQNLPMETTLVEQLARDDVGRFLEEAYDLAQSRTRELNDAFLLARGLNSKEGVRAIAEMAHDYDYVLVHGVQFGFIYDVCAALSKVGKPFALIPHLHLDDFFYHWKPFYECVATASTVVCPENEIYRSFLPRLEVGNLVQIAGGGINPNEFEALDDSQERAAREKHDLAQKPYFVIIGRKAPSKGYRAALEAFEIGDFVEQMELIIIGPDDDRVPISQKGVRYLGALDRSEMLSLLRGSVGLITMSESESFGIVVVEAWMCGKPVIVNGSCAVFRDLVDDGVDGFVVEGVKALAERMHELAQSPNLRDRMGSAGRSKGLQKYDWRKIADSIGELLTNLPAFRPSGAVQQLKQDLDAG